MALTEDDKDWIVEQFRKVETSLLRAFADYNVAASTRFQKLEADQSNTDANSTWRLGELERRLTELEIRTIKLEGAKSAVIANSRMPCGHPCARRASVPVEPEMYRRPHL